MSLEVNTNRNTGVRTITLRNHDGSEVGTITIRSSSLKKTKKLRYGFKRISTQIMQAKTFGNAREVLTRAKGETVNLRRKLRSGDYNETEVRRAIIHAERMERIAKKRMKHLQQEENLEKHGGGTWQIGLDKEDMEEYLKEMGGQDFAELDPEEIKELMQELQEEMEQENGLEELTETIQTDMDPAELEQLKKKHRAEEMREIMEADMKYLKALFDQLQKEQQEGSSSSSGVSLELSGVEIPVQVDGRSAAEVASEGMAAQAGAVGNTIDISV